MQPGIKLIEIPSLVSKSDAFLDEPRYHKKQKNDTFMSQWKHSDKQKYTRWRHYILKVWLVC